MSLNKRIADLISFCLGILLIGVMIQWAGNVKDNALVFPGVQEIGKAFLRLIREENTWLMMEGTLTRLVQSMVLATSVGITLGMLQGMNRFLRHLLNPLMVFLRSMPMIILIFIFIVVVSREHRPFIPVMASTLVLIPMISEAACEGCRRIDRELIDVYRMNSRFNLRVLVRVYLPLMSGYLKQAYVSAVGMGVKLAVSTEYMVGISDTLGNAVQSSRDAVDYQDIYAYALIMILMVILVSEVPLALLHWYDRRKERSV